MRKSIRVTAATLTLALGGLGLVACSSSSPAPGSPGAADATIPADQYGPITVVQGKDNNGVLPKYAALWNKDHPDQKVTFKEQSDQADQQLQDLLQNFQQKLPDYDVVSTDVVWTQQLASQGYLQPLTGPYKLDESGVLPSVLATSMYRDVQYAAPSSTDAQILYYRKDWLGDKPVPTTYDEMFSLCDIAKSKGAGCYAGQFAKYEGLTVNFSEAVNSAGGSVVNDKGQPTLDTPEAKKGLETLVNGFKDGDIPRQAISYQEEPGRQAFESGKLMFYTNWPYQYSLTTTGDQSFAKDDPSALGIAPFPGKSSLGGHNWAISMFSKHKGTALEFLKWYQTAEIQKMGVEEASSAPVLASVYDDAELAKQFPYLPTLKKSLDNAVPRPASPFYQAVSTAIQNNAYAALQGNKSVDQALSDMSTAIKQASGS
ncbi:ABC transporter substrate-binding protein [Amnibacterium endophyticum]|uniref:ABC transporter substrate-binding protein n=1 Tax=Amnibacterium endophyticum TaxID=2109337 RepID=A0ABW4LFN1_9MICO